MSVSGSNKLHFLKSKNHEIFRAIYISCIFVFCLLPLIFLLVNISSSDITHVFKDKNFYSALGNSFLYTFISASISVVLSLLTAYFLTFSNIKGKKVFVVLLTLSMLVPSFSIGLGIRVLGGINGFLDQLFHIHTEFIGMPGLIIGSVTMSFPPTFLVLFDSLRYENKESYDAANIMGVKRLSTFFHITLPYLKKPLITAFLACFTLIFSDYGIPMELMGRVKTLPMYLYEEATVSFRYGRSALVGLVLLIPAVVSFILDFILKEDKGDEAKKQNTKPSTLFNVISIIVISLVFIILFIPQLSFISLAFMEGYPHHIHFSLTNLSNVFSSVHGIGLTNYIINSLVMSLLTGLFGTVFAFTAAYFCARFDGKLGKVLNFISVSSIAIPGIVLGIGYIFLFKDTNGFFYGTMAILVAVNIAHFLGSPFIMAKNCLSKINKDYEVIGDTLGISKVRIFFKVLVPNSIGTIIEMFSFLFLNSMITISAVAFLSTYKTQPLSILITTYERNGKYEMQAVVSFIILVINLLFKLIIGVIQKLIDKNKHKKEGEYMALNKYQFALLTFIEKKGKIKFTQKMLADELTISLTTVGKELAYATEMDYLQINSKNEIEITEKGLKALEPYRVRKAIIIGAGFGSRMAPVTLDTPKPMVTVNGKRIIDTIIDALVSKGITNIVIVRGYKKEKFDALLEKYPFIKFIDNEEYNRANNISSLIRATEYIDRCYICDADLMISNPDVINKYEYATNYLGIKVEETEDWCFTKKGYYIDSYKQGGEDCYQFIGISYWDESDSVKLKAAVQKLYKSRGGKECFWDDAALKYYKKDFKIQIRKCYKSDIVEIDNFSELVALDPSYKDYPGHENF